MPHSAVRTIDVEGVYNLRDVGGYRAGGQITKWQTLYRSDALDKLTDRGREQLHDLGIARVVDLRDDSERRFAPSALADTSVIVANPIFQGVDDTLRRPDVTLEEFYLHLVANFGANYVAALRHILATDDQPVLVHCTAGKDRTGTLVAFTLNAVGVDNDDVLHDYAQTEQLLSGEWAEQHLSLMLSHGVTLTPSIERLLFASPTEALAHTLDYVEREFGSVSGYLRAHGFTEHERETLSAKLLTTPNISAG
jgi:protein-tyrosine phosphatase